MFKLETIPQLPFLNARRKIKDYKTFASCRENCHVWISNVLKILQLDLDIVQYNTAMTEFSVHWQKYFNE